jgi:hypothetical protein
MRGVGAIVIIIIIIMAIPIIDCKRAAPAVAPKIQLKNPFAPHLRARHNRSTMVPVQGTGSLAGTEQLEPFFIARGVRDYRYERNVIFASCNLHKLAISVPSPPKMHLPSNDANFFFHRVFTVSLANDWPGIRKEEIGHTLVQKGTNFVSNSRQLLLEYLDEFLAILLYEARPPDKINVCGIRINQITRMFYTSPSSISNQRP